MNILFICNSQTNIWYPSLSVLLICVHSSDDYFLLYRLSYLWYVVIGFLVTLLVGVICSCIVNWCSKELRTTSNPDLFAPPIQRYVKQNYHTKATVDDDDDDDDVSLIYNYLCTRICKKKYSASIKDFPLLCRSCYLTYCCLVSSWI